MAEYYSKEALLDALAQGHAARSEEAEVAILDAWERIKKLPAADVVEVVRCKDCKYYLLGHLQCVYAHHNGVINFDGYCSYGERREK